MQRPKTLRFCSNRKNFYLFTLFFVLLLFSGCTWRRSDEEAVSSLNVFTKSVNEAQAFDENLSMSENMNINTEPATKTFATHELVNIDPHLNFRAAIPAEWLVVYIPGSSAINIYNPSAPGESTLEQSQIFVRYFIASSFLILNTVTIYSREELQINGRPVVRYDIDKKEGVNDFPSQPSWRNRRHFVTDIRSTDEGPTTFYVFGKRPELDDAVFEAFLRSVEFNPPADAAVYPLSDFHERISKKPFGIFISPKNSPVQPERFFGYHTGVDLETFDSEQQMDVSVRAIADGEIILEKIVSGYGGVVIIAHYVSGSTYSVVYGHLDIGSVEQSVGETVSLGEVIGVLGEGFTNETDGERKHLHFGILPNRSTDIRGYVETQEELTLWRDPTSFFE